MSTSSPCCYYVIFHARGGGQVDDDFFLFRKWTNIKLSFLQDYSILSTIWTLSTFCCPLFWCQINQPQSAISTSPTLSITKSISASGKYYCTLVWSNQNISYILCLCKTIVHFTHHSSSSLMLSFPSRQKIWTLPQYNISPLPMMGIIPHSFLWKMTSSLYSRPWAIFFTTQKSVMHWCLQR